MDITTPSSDHWLPADSDLCEATSFLMKELEPVRRNHFVGFDPYSVDSHNLLGASVYSSMMTDEHEDVGFKQWTALLILQSREHTVTTRYDDEKGLDITPLVEGQILMFDLHKTHALDVPDAAFETEHEPLSPEHVDYLRENHLFIATHVDFDYDCVDGTLPPREVAEQQLKSVLGQTITLMNTRSGPTP